MHLIQLNMSISVKFELESTTYEKRIKFHLYMTVLYSDVFFMQKITGLVI